MVPDRANPTDFTKITVQVIPSNLTEGVLTQLRPSFGRGASPWDQSSEQNYIFTKVCCPDPAAGARGRISSLLNQTYANSHQLLKLVFTLQSPVELV